MKPVLLFLVLLAGSLSVEAAEITVPDDFATIQEAIDGAGAGDTILVRPGVYKENVDFKGKAVTLRSASGPKDTVIDGNRTGSPVRFSTGEGQGSVLDGFRLCNGIGTRDSWNLHSGGGIFCSGAAPAIINNVIADNEAKSGYGGGIFLIDCQGALISGNLVTGNRSANCGGGIYSRLSCPVIEGNVIRGNEAAKFGGAITCSYSSSSSVVSNLLCDNRAGQCGGGLASYNSRPSIRNNTIFGNIAVMRGGGIYLWLSNGAEVINNTLCENLADMGGGFACDGASTTIVNSIIYGNDARVGRQILVGSDSDPSEITGLHCNIEGGPASVVKGTNCLFVEGAGLLDADPVFADSDDGDFHLSYTSPCRDAGCQVNSLPSEDFEGDARVVNGVVDVGADEFFFHLCRKGDVVPGGTVEIQVMGWPGMPTRLGIGAAALDIPQVTPFGLLFLEQPISVERLGRIPETGVLVVPVVVPVGWEPGDSVPIQVLVGGNRSPASTLTNLVEAEVVQAGE